MTTAVAEYMRVVRRDQKRLTDNLRSLCEKLDRDPDERYHNTQAGTLKWAASLIRKLGVATGRNIEVPADQPHCD